MEITKSGVSAHVRSKLNAAVVCKDDRSTRFQFENETPNWSQNMWCFSVVFHVATCEFEIAKTGRRSISKDGIGRSHQDLAIRKLGNRVNPAFAQNTAVADGSQDATHKSRTWSGMA